MCQAYAPSWRLPSESLGVLPIAPLEANRKPYAETIRLLTSAGESPRAAEMDVSELAAWTALGQASVPWLAVTAAVGAVTYLMAAISLIGAAGQSLA